MVPLTLLLVACTSAREKPVRIVIVPELDAVNAVRRQQQTVKLTDLVFKQNQANRIDEHPFFFRDNNLQTHGDGCESVLAISISRLEEVVWEADSAFRILDIAKSGNKPNCNPAWQDQELAPPNPFYGTMPYISSGPVAPFRVYSGPARPQSVNQHYKIKIQILGQILDPDLICMS
jgi:hypothetical protein